MPSHRPIIILVPFALIACHPLGPKLETDPQCQQNRNDIEGHIAHPKQPPAITVAGEWGNAGGGATWVFHQTGARVRIEVGDLYTDELGRQQYTVDTVMNGTVDGATLYYFDRGPAGVSYGTLSLTGNVLAGPRWGECFLNREFQLARLR